MSEVQKIEQLFSSEINSIVSYLEEWFPKVSEESYGMGQLHSSVRYSIFSSGKRFRPILSLLTARALGQDEKYVVPFAVATELVHTYSLIHDDLPLMDNDDFRRGRPTNHKVYGDAMALLAGDALLTEAFSVVSENYLEDANKGLRATALLAKAVGLHGMVGGQAIDIKALEGHQVEFDELIRLHNMKTGALIAVAIEGAAVLSGASVKEQKALKDFGLKLGLAFQVADDILDHREDGEELSGFPKIIGLSETEEYLKKITEEAKDLLDGFGDRAVDLLKITEFNYNRV